MLTMWKGYRAVLADQVRVTASVKIMVEKRGEVKEI